MNVLAYHKTVTKEEKKMYNRIQSYSKDKIIIGFSSPSRYQTNFKIDSQKILLIVSKK